MQLGDTPRHSTVGMSHALRLLLLLPSPEATRNAAGWPSLAANASSAVVSASDACPQNIVVFITSYLHASALWEHADGQPRSRKGCAVVQLTAGSFFRNEGCLRLVVDNITVTFLLADGTSRWRKNRERLGPGR